MSRNERDFDTPDRAGGCLAVAAVAAMVALLAIAGLLANGAGMWP